MSLSGRIPEGIILPPGKLLLAFSGGSDSLFLMAVLSLLAPERTEALYVDHALRPRAELDAEAELNKRNAELLGIPLRIEMVPEGMIASIASGKGIGTEAAAREVRYSILRKAAAEGNFTRILTAHHREDQVETVLMRILSGSPFFSYQGIVRDDGSIFRPILSVPKREILSFLEDSGLRWSEDSTNGDTSYLRNSIRRFLLPAVTEEARNSIAAIAANVALLRRNHPPLTADEGFCVSIARESFLSALPFQQEEVIFRSFRRFGCGERIPRSFIGEIVRKAQLGNGRAEAFGIHFYFSSTSIRIFPPLQDFVTSLSGGEARCGRIALRRTVPDSRTLIIDEKKLVPPVILRTSREGDEIMLKGGLKKVSELEKDMRVPYSLVLEDRVGIAAFFARFAGGRDRLSSRLLSASPEGTALAIEIE